jgi:hypothetical protein
MGTPYLYLCVIHVHGIILNVYTCIHTILFYSSRLRDVTERILNVYLVRRKTL